MERRQLERSQSPVKGLTLFVVLTLSVSAAAQTAEPKVTGTLSNVTRVESWRYFQPAGDPLATPTTPNGDPDYTFFANRSELGVHVEGVRFDLAGAFNYVRLENLPPDAIGPGGLGTGAFYFAATALPYSYQLYFGELTARIKFADRRTSVTIGRMPFSSGGESVSANPRLELIKRTRLQSRLIGNFEFAMYQRRFDGVRVDVDGPRWHVNAAAFVPTQGGFEESANLSIPKLQIGSASLTRKLAAAEFQAFTYVYRDRRSGAAVVDNSGSADRPVDITIGTFGGSYARLAPMRGGEFDAVTWGAVQAGDWYGRAHRAGSLAVEGGFRWNSVALKPWLRGGYLWASGDADGNDGRHGTFFQMIPTSRKYALSTVYAQMNLRDLFAQLAIEPGRVRARIEVHDVDLASAADLWYAGSGANASTGRYFGFAGRTSGGQTTLGTVVEATVDVPITRYWSVGTYAATMSAGGAVRHFFTDRRLTFFFVENTIRF